jgi:ATP-dependent helicase/nuclease subunit B
MRKNNVFTIPPAAPFLKVLARSIAEGTLVEGFRYDPADPLSLAAATIYLPTRRAARVLRSEFVDLLGGRSAILPVIRALGEVDDDAGYFDEALEGDLDLLPPVAGMTRLLELARLVLAWRNRLPQHLLSIHDDSPLVAPASPADAIWLARSLVELIDAVETEETGWAGVDRFQEADRALWWELSGAFIKVASTYWPERLAELGRSSPTLHRNLALRAEAERMGRNGSLGPVIVAGSTGSIPATAALIGAIHRLDHGAVVLPGLDLFLSEPEWRLAGALRADGLRDTDPASRSHPQYGLHHLLARLGVARNEVIALGSIAPADELRAEAVSTAFLPAGAEVQHHAFRTAHGEALAEAFEDMALVEALNEREEALAIAIALKCALDRGGPHVQSALITPDRTLARRVSAELLRFGIEADDSAGRPLATSEHGSLLTLTLDCVLRPGDPVALASLLKHPLVRLGRNRETLDPVTHALELLALRGGTARVDIATLTATVTEAVRALAAEERYPKIWQRRIRTIECKAEVLELARDLETAVEPLARLLIRDAATGLRREHPAGEWAAATGRVLEALSADERGNLALLWSGDAGDALARLLQDLIEAGNALSATAPQWADMASALMAGIGIKPRSMGHARVFIWGTLEARLQSVDTLVLGGLNESVWPAATTNNPFLSRAMKTEMGLEPPERRIGQSAHDFVMGLGTRKVILTRALRQGGAPSVASRFLQRLLAVTGAEIAGSMRARGADYLAFAAEIDATTAAERQAFSARPAPKPEPERQPSRYSFSEVTKLRRDPYAVYARRVLRLDPLDPFNHDPGATDRGTIYHAIVQRFIEQGIEPRSAGADAALAAIVHRVFAESALPPHVDAVWRPRALDMAKRFLAWEAERRPLVARSEVEKTARMEIADGLALGGRADRIDILRDGRADIIDYKTGAGPSAKVARTLLDPQLALEAAALVGGGFAGVEPREVRDLSYVRLRPGSRFAVDRVNNEGGKGDDARSSTELAGEALSQLIKLATALRERKAGFKSRVAPVKDGDHGGEYDHLARVAEWSVAEAEGGEGDD